MKGSRRPISAIADDLSRVIEHFAKLGFDIRRGRISVYADVLEDDPDYRFWSMTTFRFAGDYLELMSALAAKRNISEQLRSRLVRGLNRVMTGLLIENTDKIFVASSGGFTQSRISVLCDTESRRWVYGAGTVLPGLVARRGSEISLLSQD